MSNEAQIIENPANTVVIGETTISESYQAQNSRAESVSNGVDNSYIYADGGNIILPVCGGIDVNGVFYAITTETTLTPSADGTYYIYLSGSGDNLTPTLGIDKGTFDPVKNGYYYSGYRVLNWEIDLHGGVFIIGRIQFDSPLTLDNAVKVIPPTKAGCQCDIDGEGTPQIPDDPDGVTYQNADNWVDGVDGWIASASSCSVAITGGKLTLTPTGSTSYVRILKTGLPNNGNFICKITSNADGDISILGRTIVGSSIETICITTVEAYKTNIINCFISSDYDLVYIDITQNTDIIEIETIQEGDGTYTTGTPDHSGTQNPATNTAVTPVDSKWGKLGHYNGVTSNLEFNNPVIGTTGTIRIIITNTDDFSDYMYIMQNHSSLGGILVATFITTGYFYIRVYDSTGSYQQINLTGKSPLDIEMLHVVLTDTTVMTYTDGDIFSNTALTITPEIGDSNLIFGRGVGGISRLKADASINYTTEQFTASQVKSDYNNPRKFSNEPVSETGLKHSLVRRGADGEGTFNGVDTGDGVVYLDQDLKTTDSPTFADLLITGLGAMKTHFTNWISWLNQGLKTTDSPTFSAVTATARSTIAGIELTASMNTDGNTIDLEGGKLQSGGGDIKTEDGDFDNGAGHFLPCTSPLLGTVSATVVSTYVYFPRGTFDLLTPTGSVIVSKSVGGPWATITSFPATGCFSSGTNLRIITDDVSVDQKVQYSRH